MGRQDYLPACSLGGVSPTEFSTDGHRGSEKFSDVPKLGRQSQTTENKKKRRKTTFMGVEKPREKTSRSSVFKRNGPRLHTAVPGRKHPCSVLDTWVTQLPGGGAGPEINCSHALDESGLSPRLPTRAGWLRHWLPLKNAVRKCLWRRDRALDK